MAAEECDKGLGLGEVVASSTGECLGLGNSCKCNFSLRCVAFEWAICGGLIFVVRGFMSKIYLLDCTLRDGGYVNNWEFGYEAIAQIKTGLEDSGIDIIEIGFFRNEPWNHDRSVFGGAEDISHVMKQRKANVSSTIMIIKGEI